MITRGTKQEYAASTLCAVIIGNRSPKTTMIGDSIPVRDDGNTTWFGTSTRLPSRSLYQCTRNRLRGSAASLSTPFVMSCEISRGSANSPKVGSTIFCAAKRFTLLSRDAGSTTVLARPSCSCNAVASRARFREDASVIVTGQVCHL